MHLAGIWVIKKNTLISLFLFHLPSPKSDPGPELKSPKEGVRRWRESGGSVGCQGHSTSQMAVLAGCLIVVVSAALCSEGLNEE